MKKTKEKFRLNVEAMVEPQSKMLDQGAAGTLPAFVRSSTGTSQLSLPAEYPAWFQIGQSVNDRTHPSAPSLPALLTLAPKVHPHTEAP